MGFIWNLRQVDGEDHNVAAVYNNLLSSSMTSFAPLGAFFRMVQHSDRGGELGLPNSEQFEARELVRISCPL